MIETWLSYDLADLLMFSDRVYYRQIALANASAWPLHVAMLLAGLALALSLHAPSATLNRVAAAILAAAWGSSCWFFVVQAYGQIHWAGHYMTILFLVEAAALLVLALVPGGLAITRPGPLLSWVRSTMVLAVTLSYPALALVSGRTLSSVEMFGVAADPTALLMLLVIASSAAGWQLLLCVPAWLWLALSASTLWAMGSVEVWVVLAALVACPVIILARVFATPSTTKTL